VSALSIRSAAIEAGDRIALSTAGVSYSYAALAARTAQAIDRIADRGSDGRPVPLVAAPTIDAIAGLFALIELGRPALLLHPRAPEVERARAVENLVPLADPSTTLAIVATAGSTGVPKGVCLPRRAFLASAEASARRLGWRDDDRWLCALSFAHVGGLSILTRCLIARRTVVLAERSFRPAELVRCLDENRVTLLSLVPAQLRALVEEDLAPPPSLRAILVGGAAASPDLLARAAARAWPVRATYGLSEACSQVATARPGDPFDTCGPPLEGVGLRIATDGTVEVAGPTLTSGYYPPNLHAPPFASDGWLRTGDLGELDAKGRLRVLGRRDQVIVTGGEKVHPVEIEQALERCPGIASACAFSLPDDRFGALVAAALVAPTPPADSQLRAHLDRELAPWKRPRKIAYLPSLPTTAAGKIDRLAVARAAVETLRFLQN
jgi:O-succinylbenzoic acid--CoA ligase